VGCEGEASRRASANSRHVEWKVPTDGRLNCRPSAFQKVCRPRCHRVSLDQSAQLERIHPGGWADTTILTPVRRCAGECRFVRVARVLDASWPRTCVALVLAAAAPVSRRACTPDPALSHWHACQPAAVNADHFHPMPTAARRPGSLHSRLVTQCHESSDLVLSGVSRNISPCRHARGSENRCKVIM